MLFCLSCFFFYRVQLIYSISPCSKKVAFDVAEMLRTNGIEHLKRMHSVSSLIDVTPVLINAEWISGAWGRIVLFLIPLTCLVVERFFFL